MAANKTGLDGGTINFQGPYGSTALQDFGEGIYDSNLSGSIVPAVGITVVLTGTGQTSASGSVGPLNASLTIPSPAPLTWTQSECGSHGEPQPGTHRHMEQWRARERHRSSSNKAAVGSFEYYAPQSAGQFTVPDYILMALPAGSGLTAIQDQLPTPVSVTGIQYMYGLAFTGIAASSKFQ